MKPSIRALAAAVLFFSGSQVFGQYYSTGVDPGGTRWREIKTTNFDIIFPDDCGEQARELASRLEKAYQYGYRTLGKAPRKISVVLHTQTVNSNGMVAWTPKRMELYPTPNQRVYAQNWLDQLAIHEFRHVVQMDEIETELPIILKALFGEQAATAIAGAYLPFWFLEGDAVITETALTQSGRGRNPSFLMENKAQAVEKGLFSYDKATLGSYRDYVPNRYSFGWWMVGGIRAKYGEQVWKDALHKTATQPWSVTPLNSTLKKHTGKNKELLYRELFSNYLSEWKKEVDQVQQSAVVPVSEGSKTYTNYLYNQVLDNGTVVAYKQSRDDIGRIVAFENGRERILFTPGSILDESFSARGTVLIWSERRADVRWDHADKSVIVTYDFRTKKKREFNSNLKLFSPVISPDRKRFAAVGIDNPNNCQLGIFDLETGKQLAAFPTDGNNFAIAPAWSADGKFIYYIGLGPQGKYLGRLTAETGKFESLSSATRADRRNLSVAGNRLIFTSAESGIDNVYAFNLNTGETTQLTNVSFGADYAKLTETGLYFSNYTADGYQLTSLASEAFLNKPAVDQPFITNALADKLAGQDAGIPDMSAPDSAQFQSKPYRKLAHLFNFHSWAPAYVSVNDYEIRPGVSLFSQNKLGTATTNLGYDYDWSERSGKYRANFEYSGLFPILYAEAAYGKRKSVYRLVQQNGSSELIPFSWNELNYEVGAKVPLRFSQGKWSQYVLPQIEYSRTQISHNSTTPKQFYEGFYHAMVYRLYAQNLLRWPELGLMPKWGQVFDLVYKNSPAGGTSIGDLKALQTFLYLPGLYRNQGIRIYNGFQKKNTDEDILFSDVVRFPRGIQRISNTDLYTFSADYVVPICYPDWSVSKLFYLKRLRASVFYDFSSLRGKTYNQDGSVHSLYEKYLTSVGVECTGDGHFLRLPAPVSIGLRSMYLPDFKESRFELLFSIDFGAI